MWWAAIVRLRKAMLSFFEVVFFWGFFSCNFRARMTVRIVWLIFLILQVRKQGLTDIFVQSSIASY